MGYRALIQSLVQDAIVTTVGDLNSTITFRSVVTGAYNTDTGVVTRTVTEYEAKCVLTKVRQDDSVDLNLIRTGKKALVPVLELPTTLSVDALDDLVEVDGIEYTISAITLDSSGSLYSFMLLTRDGVQLGGS